MSKPITDEQVANKKDLTHIFSICCDGKVNITLTKYSNLKYELNEIRNQAIINERERIYKELKEWGFDWVVEKVFKIEKLTK